MKLPEFAPKLSPAEETDLFKRMQRHKKGARYEKARSALVMSVMKEAVGYLRSRWVQHRFSDGDLISICYKALTRAASNFNPCHPDSVNFFRYSKPYLRGFVWAEYKRLTRLHGCTSINNTMDENSESEDSDVFPEGDALVDPAFDEIHTRERWAILQPFLEVLNEHEQEIIRLFYFSGLKLAEIADKRKVSRQAVQATHNRAILKIRRALIRKKLL